MDLGLQDHVTLVTDGSHGMGRASAETFAAEGASVVLMARGADRLNEAAKAIHAATGRETLALVADLADPATPQRVM